MHLIRITHTLCSINTGSFHLLFILNVLAPLTSMMQSFIQHAEIFFTNIKATVDFLVTTTISHRLCSSPRASASHVLREKSLEVFLFSCYYLLPVTATSCFLLMAQLELCVSTASPYLFWFEKNPYSPSMGKVLFSSGFIPLSATVRKIMAKPLHARRLALIHHEILVTR